MKTAIFNHISYLLVCPTLFFLGCGAPTSSDTAADFMPPFLQEDSNILAYIDSEGNTYGSDEDINALYRDEANLQSMAAGDIDNTPSDEDLSPGAISCSVGGCPGIPSSCSVTCEAGAIADCSCQGTKLPDHKRIATCDCRPKRR